MIDSKSNNLKGLVEYFLFRFFSLPTFIKVRHLSFFSFGSSCSSLRSYFPLILPPLFYSFSVSFLFILLFSFPFLFFFNTNPPYLCHFLLSLFIFYPLLSPFFVCSQSPPFPYLSPILPHIFIVILSLLYPL